MTSLLGIMMRERSLTLSIKQEGFAKSAKLAVSAINRFEHNKGDDKGDDKASALHGHSECPELSDGGFLIDPPDSASLRSRPHPSFHIREKKGKECIFSL